MENVNGKSYRFQRLWGSVSSDGSICIVRFIGGLLEVEKRKKVQIPYAHITGVEENFKLGIGELIAMLVLIAVAIGCFSGGSVWGIAPLIMAAVTAFNLKVHVIVLQTTNGKVQIPMAKKEEGLNDFLCSLNNATYGRLQNQINALIK